jgi:hypothetical protein
MGVKGIVAGAGAGFLVGGPIGAAIGAAAAGYATKEPDVVVVPPGNHIVLPEIELTGGGPGPVYAPNDVLNPDLPFTPGYLGYGAYGQEAQPSHARTIFTGLVLIGGIVYFMGGFDRLMRRL